LVVTSPADAGEGEELLAGAGVVTQQPVHRRRHRARPLGAHTSQRQLNQVGPLQVQVCRGCLPDLLGDAPTAPAATGAVGCDIRVDLAVVEGAARDWDLPVTQVVATLLTHEQEHCIRHPDDRETPAIDAERRLARKLGGGGLLEYVTSRYRELDRSGHWKQ
jgi:hypothetical protein